MTINTRFLHVFISFVHNQSVQSNSISVIFQNYENVT